MPINFSGRDKAGLASLSLLGSILIILPVLFSSFNSNVEAQNQPKEEKTIHASFRQKYSSSGPSGSGGDRDGYFCPGVILGR